MELTHSTRVFVGRTFSLYLMHTDLGSLGQTYEVGAVIGLVTKNSSTLGHQILVPEIRYWDVQEVLLLKHVKHILVVLLLLQTWASNFKDGWYLEVETALSIPFSVVFTLVNGTHCLLVGLVVVRH